MTDTLNVYCGGFPFEFTDSQLADVFESAGFPIARAKVILDRDKGNIPKGFGFVSLNEADVPRAIAQLNGATVGSRYLKVSEASGQGARAAGGVPVGGLARGAQPPRVHSAERSPPRHRSRAPDAREREPRDGYSRPERSGWDDRPPREAAPFSDRDRDRDRGGYRASPPRGREAVAPSREWRDSPPRARRGEREREHASLAEAYIPPRIPPPWERRDPYENDAFNKLPDAEARPAYGGRQDEPPRGGGAYRDAPPGRYYEETERYAPPRAGGYGGGYGASPPRYESVRDGGARAYNGRDGQR